MHGNVWEWCEDWHGNYPAGSVTDPKGLATGESRVLRGGSFNFFDLTARSSYRFFLTPTTRNYLGLGFRLAITANIKAAVATPIPAAETSVAEEEGIDIYDAVMALRIPTVETSVAEEEGIDIYDAVMALHIPTVEMPVNEYILIVPFTEAKAKEIQKSVAKILQKEVEEKVDLGKGIKLDLVLIPVGKFMMGSPAFETGRRDNEMQHEVTLTKPFYMGKYEVTQEQWKAVMGTGFLWFGGNPSDTKGAKLPVTNVSWEDCQEFIKKLNVKTNSVYRLPTEAEWEYACKAGTTTAYSVGDNLTKSDANIGYGIAGSIKAVGSYNPNAFGLYDMHGNVDEWCEDWFGDYPAGPVTDPKGAATGEYRVQRGGCFLYGESDARSSYRLNIFTPTTPYFYNGFRLARNP